MHDSVANGLEAPQRIHCLDFLRGFFVFLALWQHFAYYLNYWYLDFYQGWSFWGEAFTPHVEYVGSHIFADGFSSWAAWFFTPWVSQIYLFLAAFNLAKRDQKALKEKINIKLLSFVILFFLFTTENMIVAPNIGEAFSLYPLQTWMIILGLVLGVYCWLGEKGVWALAVLGLVRLGLPLDSLYEGIEDVVRLHLHKNFEIDARPDYFLTSGALGFLLGRRWWQGKKEQLPYWIATGGAGLLLWFLFGQEFIVHSQDVFATEHLLAQTFLGSIGIHGIELLVVGTFLYFAHRGFDCSFKFLNWIGRYSLLVFFLHRILFLKVIMPVRMLLANVFDWPLSGSFVEFWSATVIIVVLTWIIRKMRIFSMLEGSRT